MYNGHELCRQRPRLKRQNTNRNVMFAAVAPSGNWTNDQETSVRGTSVVSLPATETSSSRQFASGPGPSASGPGPSNSRPAKRPQGASPTSAERTNSTMCPAECGDDTVTVGRRRTLLSFFCHWSYHIFKTKMLFELVT